LITLVCKSNTYTSTQCSCCLQSERRRVQSLLTKRTSLDRIRSTGYDARYRWQQKHLSTGHDARYRRQQMSVRSSPNYSLTRSSAVVRVYTENFVSDSLGSVFHSRADVPVSDWFEGSGATNMCELCLSASARPCNLSLKMRSASTFWRKIHVVTDFRKAIVFLVWRHQVWVFRRAITIEG
jgi:hypothetical protein